MRGAGRRGGGDFLLKIRGGGSPGRVGAGGRGAGRVSAGNLGGRGLNIFFRGRNSHQALFLKGWTKIHRGDWEVVSLEFCFLRGQQ